MASQLYPSIGFHGFYGLSAAFDFTEAIEASIKTAAVVDEPLRILLVGPGDVRHIIATVSRRRRHRTKDIMKYKDNKWMRPIHFYFIETPIEVVARNILLLELVNDYEIPIRQRASVFLEIFGNCRVQDRTAKYIEQLGQQLRSLVTAGTGRLEGLIDLSLLRYRERDDLENTFKSYSKATSFDVDSLRDHRLRGLYGDRYDNRKALSDWDYHNNIKAKASIIHIKQYKEWCNSGIAFEFGDQSYTEPNRSMMSYAEGVMKKGKEKGLKKEVRGLWTDIVSSPYYSFGVDCETPNAFAEGLFEIFNKNSGSEQHRHHTVEVSLYSLLSYLWEIETGHPYKMTKIHDIYSGLGTEGDQKEEDLVDDSSSDELLITDDSGGDAVVVSNVTASDSSSIPLTVDKSHLPLPADGGSAVEVDKDDNETVTITAKQLAAVDLQETEAPANTTATIATATAEREESNIELVKQIQRAENIAETFMDMKIFPLLGDASQLDKPKYTNLFDGIFVSARSAQCIQTSSFSKLLKAPSEGSGGGLIAIETAKFLVPLSKKMQADFRDKEEEYAASHGWKNIPPPVYRRRRDELDLEDDVIFFVNQ